MPEPHKHPKPDDREIELPPMDGGDDDVEAPAPDLEDDEGVKDDGGDPLDDATRESDPLPELDIDESEKGWTVDGEGGKDAADAEGIDIGAPDVLGGDEDGRPAAQPGQHLNEDLLRDNDEPGVGDEDYGLDDEDAAPSADAGEEGPDADDEELREEDLPRLDSDEEGQGEDAEFFDAAFVDADGGEARLAWAEEPWERAGAPVRVDPLSAIVCAWRGVVAAGQALWRIDLEGACEALSSAGLGSEGVVDLAVQGDDVAAAGPRGLYVSKDRGGVFREVGEDLARVAFGGGRLWAATGAGELSFSEDLGATWRRAELAGAALAMSTDDRGALVALVLRADGRSATQPGQHLGEPPLAVARASGDALSFAPLPAPGSASDEGFASHRIVARGAAVAVITRRGVLRTLDGAAWSLLASTDGATAIAFIDDEGTLLVALAGEADERPLLVRVARDGRARIVAEVGEPRPEGDDEPVIAALAWDDARGVLWVAGAFGVAAFAPRVRAA